MPDWMQMTGRELISLGVGIVIGIGALRLWFSTTDKVLAAKTRFKRLFGKKVIY